MLAAVIPQQLPMCLSINSQVSVPKFQRVAHGPHMCFCVKLKPTISAFYNSKHSVIKDSKSTSRTDWGIYTENNILYNHSANSTDNNVLFLSRFCFFFWTGLSINSTPSDLQVTLPQESKEFLFHWSTSNCSAALLILAFDLTLKLLFTSWQKLQLLHVILYLKTGKR